MLRSLSGTAAFVALFLLAAPACKRHRQVYVDDTLPDAPGLASTVRMGDLARAGQLAAGFYDVEANSWRWTMRKFAVILAPPHSSSKGALLELHLTVPPPSIAKLGSLTLSAAIGGAALAPETYSRAGEYVYRREVASNLLAGDSVRVDFQLDKAVPPGDSDRRELGIVATSVGLVSR